MRGSSGTYWLNADALLHAEVMAIAATDIAWSTPSRVTLRHPLGRGMAGLLLGDGIWSSWELWQSMSERTVYLTVATRIPARRLGSETRWTSTPPTHSTEATGSPDP